MRLVNAEYGITLELEENRISVLVIERKQLRLKIIQDLNRQCMGGAGGFVLSEHEKLLKIQNAMDILLNPFSFDCNNRKVLTKLFQEIRDCGIENYFTEKERINGLILTLFDKIMLNLPYNIRTTLDFDLVDLCKLYNVQIEETGDALIEGLLDYMKVMNQLCGYTVFVLLNFTMYLSSEELQNLYEFAAYQKIYLLLIEHFESELINNEKCCIIDGDSCIINTQNDNLWHLPSVKFGENLNDEFEV